MAEPRRMKADEGRLSRPVSWEGGGEIPLPDPISTNYNERLNKQ